MHRCAPSPFPHYQHWVAWAQQPWLSSAHSHQCPPATSKHCRHSKCQSALFFFSCSSLCLDQCKTQVRNQWHWLRTSFLWEAWGRMDTGAAQHTAKKWHCMQKISNIRDKAITWRALCSMQTSCCVMMLHTSRLFVTSFSFISPEVHSFYCCGCWIFINPSLTIPLLRSH